MRFHAVVLAFSAATWHVSVVTCIANEIVFMCYIICFFIDFEALPRAVACVARSCRIGPASRNVFAFAVLVCGGLQRAEREAGSETRCSGCVGVSKARGKRRDRTAEHRAKAFSRRSTKEMSDV